MIIATSRVPAGNCLESSLCNPRRFSFLGVFHQLRTGYRMLRQPFFPGVIHKTFTLNVAIQRNNSRSIASPGCSIPLFDFHVFGPWAAALVAERCQNALT